MKKFICTLLLTSITLTSGIIAHALDGIAGKVSDSLQPTIYGTIMPEEANNTDNFINSRSTTPTSDCSYINSSSKILPPTPPTTPALENTLISSENSQYVAPATFISTIGEK